MAPFKQYGKPAVAKPTKPLTLAEAFGEPVDAALKPRIIGRSYGEVKTGKTHFWLGAPGPIVYQSLDKGLEGVAVEEFDKKDIHVVEYDWEPVMTVVNNRKVMSSDLDQADAVKLRDKFFADYIKALEGGARTIIWDRESDVWSMCRYAFFGAPSDQPNNFAPLNQYYRRHVNMAKKFDCNFGLIQSMKDEWITVKKRKSDGSMVEKGSSSGNRIPVGWPELDSVVHMNLRHTRDGNDFIILPEGIRGPSARTIQGEEQVNVSFAEFGQIAFPESEESDWV